MVNLDLVTVKLAAFCIMVFSWTHLQSVAAPLTCPKPSDPKKAMDLMTSQYAIVKDNFAQLDFQTVESSAKNLVEKTACKYEFYKTKENNNQFPQVLEEAVCIGKSCFDRRCHAITFMVNVLERSKDCEGALGVRTWSVKQVPVVVGYVMT